MKNLPFIRRRLHRLMITMIIEMFLAAALFQETHSPFVEERKG